MTAKLDAAQPQLFVSDLERSCRFFQDRLGFSVAFTYGERPFYGLVVRDDAGLNLRHVDHPPLDGALREREQLLSAYIPVSDVDALYAEFERAGVVLHERLATKPWGTRQFVVRDPDGNLLCFASRAEP